MARVVRLALEFRRTFQSDVVIDMYCYRRRGHNEGDEPAFTQPLMYQVIERRPPVREAYLKHLLALNGLTQDDADRIAVERRGELERELAEARSPHYVPAREKPTGVWSGTRAGLRDADEVRPASRGAARGADRGAGPPARGIPPSSDDCPGARPAPRDGRGHPAGRLVHGRGAGVRDAGD